MIAVGTVTDFNDVIIYGVRTIGQTLGAIVMNKTDVVSSYSQKYPLPVVIEGCVFSSLKE